MNDAPVYSADSHVVEPPDLWTSRMDARYREDAPRVVTGRTGEFWVCPSLPKINVTQLGSAGIPEDQQLAFARGGYAVCRPGGWDPQERLRDMDLDRVEVEIFYCGYGLALFSHPDAAFQRAAHRTYNDWAAEFASYAPERLLPIANISMTDPEEDLRELERVVRMGFKGILVSNDPLAERRYDNPMWRSFWSAVAEYRLPVSMHILTGQDQRQLSPIPVINGALIPNIAFKTIAEMIVAGVLEHYPDLTIVCVESDIGWIPDYLRRMDWNAGRPNLHYASTRMLPGDVWRRQVYATFQDDPPGILCRDFIGVERLLWGSDYPHFNSTFPVSQEAIERNLAGVSDVERALITGGNMSRLYGLKVAAD
jgi:predicted TIM-barrel fold metal-dependent hydrolase